MDALNKLIEFVQSNPQTASVIANGLLFVVTFILVIITGIYAYQTKTMANVMKKDYDLKVKPIINARISDTSSGPQGYECRWVIDIRNRGNNIVYYRHAKCRLVIRQKIKFRTSSTILWEDKSWYIMEPLSGDYGYYVDVKLPKDMKVGSKILSTFEYAGIDLNFKTWETELSYESLT